MGPLLIGIDVGTSKVKICMFDISGKLVRQESEDILLMTTCHDCAEMALDDLMDKVEVLLKRVVLGFGEWVEAIGFSVTSPTLVFMDRELNPLRPGITYLDNRCQKEVSYIVDTLGGPDSYFKRVGNKPSPSTCTAGLINHIRKNETEIWSKTYKIGLLNTFLAARFTGKVFAEPTTASYSGLMDIRKPFDWDDELIRLSGIDKKFLPEMKHSFFKAGGLGKDMARVTGLKEGIPVALGSADTASAAFALGLRSHGDTFESMGTSEVLTYCLDKPDLDPAFMNRSHVIPGMWLSHGALSTAGAATSWLLNKIFPDIQDAKALDEEACKSVPGSNGLIFAPYLAGERSPMFDPLACGVILGLNLKTSREDIIRSICEGAGYGVRQLYQIGRTRWNVSPQAIKCVGGAAKSLLSLQVRADILGVEMASIEANNASAYGAAVLGGIASGIFTSLEEINYLNAVAKRVSPNLENKELYDKYFDIYDGLYPLLKQSMHRLSSQQLLKPYKDEQ